MTFHQPTTHDQSGSINVRFPAFIGRGLIGCGLSADEVRCKPDTCSLEVAADCLPTSFLDTTQPSPSSLIPTAAKCCESDSQEQGSSKAMSDPWTSRRTWLESMRYALDSLVRIYPLPVKEQDLTENGQDFTGKSFVQLTLFDLPGCSLKIVRASEQEDEQPSSQTLWRVDIPGETEPLPLLMSERHTGEADGSYSRRFPTPTVCGNYNRKGASATSGDGLATFVAKYPTPLASDWKSHSPARNATNSRPLREVIGASDGGPLNPEFVEWLMGWPIGHTELSASGMAKFRYKWRQRGASLEGSE